MTSMRGRAGTPIPPLAALFALAVLAIAWVASSDVCTRPISVSETMAGMTGMDMPSSGGGTLMLCPVVLGLIVLASLLAAWAIVAIWRDPHRTLSATLLLRSLAGLPIARTFAALGTGGATAIAAIVAVDGAGTFDLSACLTLALVVAGIAFAAIAAALLVARLVLAICTRLIVALLYAIAERGRRAAHRFVNRQARVWARRRPFAFERTLRGPPLPASA